MHKTHLSFSHVSSKNATHKHLLPLVTCGGEVITHQTQYLWDVLRQCVDDGIRPCIKCVGGLEATLGRIVGRDELNDGVGGVGKVGDGGVGVQTDRMELVAVLQTGGGTLS